MENNLGSNSLTERLIKQLRTDISYADRCRASLHLLDWLACSLAAMGDDLHGKVSRSLQIEGLNPFNSELSLNLGDRISCLGMLGNQLEMDDVHRTSILHPGPVICPVALATAISNQSTATELLDAIVVGYETTIRIGRSVGASHYRFFHNTSTCGVFGAASAASSLYQLEDKQWVSALGNAGTRTGGLWQMRHELVDSKSIHNSQAAHAGWQAAHYAKFGLTGPSSILEGEQGIFAAFSNDARPELVNKREPNWLINEVSFKPWPACRHVHPALDAIYPYLDQFDHHTIESIEVHTYADAIKFCDRPAPQTILQAKFSIQHSLAVLISEGKLALDDFGSDKRDDTTISSYRRKIKVLPSDQVNARYPQHYGAKVYLYSVDNKCYEFICRDAWGDPENPLVESDFLKKAQDLMLYGGIQKSSAQKLINAVLNLVDQNSCNELIGALNDLEY